MKKQYGRLSIGAMIGLGMLAIVGITVANLVGQYYSSYAEGARSDEQVVAAYQDMESILGQASLKVAEVAKVPGMMKDDLKEVIRAGMEGRYGEDGSQATFQWIQENYPGQVDASLYKQIQQVIEGSRNNFESAQRKFIDIRRGYQTKLNNDPLLAEGWWLKLAGFPKIDLDEYQIISSGHAKETFKTKVDTGFEF